MVQLVQVVDELLSTDLGGLGPTVYTVVALGVFRKQGLHLGLLVALLLKWTNTDRFQHGCRGERALAKCSGLPGPQNYIII